MSHLKLATLALLLAGASALPAHAQSGGLPGAVREAHAEGQARERATRGAPPPAIKNLIYLQA